MSYILDALNKAERERKRGSAPALDAGVPASTPETPARSPWPWIALLAVVFNAVLAALLIWSSLQDSGTPESEARVTTQAPAAPAPATTTAPPVAPVTPSLPAQTVTPAPAIAPAPPPDPLATLHPAKPIAPTSTLPLMTDAELQQLAREQEMEEQAARAKAEPAPAPVAADNAPPALETIPLQIELPPDLQQALPALRVDVHVYDENRANRFVMINLRRYREGDEITPELRVERITKEGLLFQFRGKRFRYLIQN